jgi:hypothetical protein
VVAAFEVPPPAVVFDGVPAGVADEIPVPFAAVFVSFADAAFEASPSAAVVTVSTAGFTFEAPPTEGAFELSFTDADVEESPFAAAFAVSFADACFDVSVTAADFATPIPVSGLRGASFPFCRVSDISNVWERNDTFWPGLPLDGLTSFHSILSDPFLKLPI